MEIPGGGESNVKPSGTKNPLGWVIKLDKTLRGGDVDIFWNHTMCFSFNCCSALKVSKSESSPKPCVFKIWE